MSFQLRIAGAPDRTTGALHLLTPQALELAQRGYTAILVEPSTPGRGIEVRRRNGTIDVQPFNNTSIAEAPPWMAKAQADLTTQINRSKTT